MKITDWKNITISAKEFLTGIVFVFTLSGVYYKLYYEQAGFKAQTEQDLKALRDQLQELNKRVGTNTDGIKDLHEDKLQRDAIERARISQGYQPMTRVK